MAAASEGNVCAVLPAFREEGRIGRVVAEVLRYIPHVLAIDDGSPDRTGAEAAAAGATVVSHPANRGKGAALHTGFVEARARGFEAVITLDADGQHDPAEIPKFMDAFRRTGIPVLIGNRMWDTARMPLVRRLTNRFMSGMLSHIMGIYVPDTQCGYRLYRTDLLPFLEVESQRFAAESEVLLQLASRGVRIGAVRISTIYGNEKSKIRPLPDTIRFFMMVWKYRRRRPGPIQTEGA
jgi:glycosyltransferase involved in cell wall biosynthesis